MKKQKRKKEGDRTVMDGIVYQLQDGVNKRLRRQLRKIIKQKRSRRSRVVHRVEREYKFSNRTLFYMKEYNSKSNIPMTIIKQSWKILIISALLSSLGGFTLNHIKQNIITIVPLLILIPALMNMVGSFGTITSSKFTNMIFFRQVDSRWWKSKALKKLFSILFLASVGASLFIGIMSTMIAHLEGFTVGVSLILKILIITTVTSVSLFGIIFILSVITGLYFYKKKMDPNNFLIPITTAVADFCSLIIFSLLVWTLF